MPSRRSRLAAIGAAGIALVATGCGTTVSNTAASGAGAPATDGLSVPSAGTTGATGPGSATTGTTGVPGAPGVTAPNGVTGPTTAPNGQVVLPPGTAPGQSAPGVTATKIYVGMIWPKNQDAVNQAAGAGGISVGDTKADGNAIIDDINKHGGIAGRKVVPVWQAVDSTSALGTFLGPGHHDAPSTGYFWRYFGDCKCLHYAGKPRAIPG